MKTYLLIFCFLILLARSSVYAGDNCTAPILGVHVNDAGLDKYGFFVDFNGNTTHTMYWDWTNPDTSLSDSTSTCQPAVGVNDQSVLQCNSTLDGCVLGSSGADFNRNPSCPFITGCDGLDDGGGLTNSDRMVVAVYTTTTTATYTSKFLVDSVNYDTTPARYPFNNSSAGAVRHQLFTMVRPQIQTAHISGGNMQVTVGIPEPTFNAAGTTGGLYGNGGVADDLLAGYKVVAVQSATQPANGLASNYNIAISDADRYIPATRPPNGGIKVSNQIDIPFSGSNHLWVAWVPVFNYSGSGCASNAACTATQVKNLDQGGGNLGTNSLSARIASPCREVQVTPVTFVYFRGTWSRAHQADLEWKTATETDTAGFNLYRSSDGGATWKQLNHQLIPAQGQGGAGATYAYTDVFPKVKRIRAWHYRVDAIDINNEVTGSLTAFVQRNRTR